MGSIRLLDNALVDQIAAGEVVERPASVVKELLDNAIDAGATTVRVDISEGGRDRIRVSDDGQGMDREDAALCVRRHATSKLARFEDFRRLRTMGFRGEALASIASVSRFRLTTRQRDAVAGTEVWIEGGAEPRIRDIGAPPGTTVDVQDLFFNVPARRKFLKARQTESHHVAEACLRAALAFPALRLVLTSNGRRVREYLPATDRLVRAHTVFSDQSLTEIRGAHDGVEIVAALGPPARARSGARHLYLFVNDRPVVDRGLARAIAFAYGDALDLGRYPAGAFFLTLPLDQVDVNAHPQKTEVRFAQASRVYDAVTRVVAKSLGTRSWGGGIRGSVAAPEAGPAGRGAGFWDARLRPGPTVDRRPGTPGHGASADETSPPPPAGPPAGADPWGLAAALRPSEPLAVRDTAPPYAPCPDQTDPRDQAGHPEQDVPQGLEAPSAARPAGPAAGDEEGAPQLRLLTPLGRAWITRAGETLLAVDPVRAARALTLLQWNRGLSKRRLLFPARVEVTATQAAAVEAEREALGALGVDATLVGPTTVAVHTLPALHPAVATSEPDPAAVLTAALAAASATNPRPRVAEALITEVVTSCAPAVLGALSELDAKARERVVAPWTADELLGRLR